MAIDAQTTKIYILDRITYDTLSQIPESEGGIKTNGVYFIRETSSQTAKIASLCVGKSKQCDVLDISDIQNVDFTDPAHNYNIPVDYRVKDKMLVCTQLDSEGNKYFRAIMWNGQKFLDCIGSNIEPDNITIRRHDSKIFGVGASMTGKSVTVDGSTYTGAPGAEIYNYVFDEDNNSSEYKHNNVAVNLYASAFGVGNKNFGIASTAFNIGDPNDVPDTIKDSLPPVPTGFTYTGIADYSLGCNSYGVGNNVAGKFNTVGGVYSDVSIYKYASFVWGNNLRAQYSNPNTVTIFGKYNYDYNRTIFAVGNGSDETHRTNAFSLDTSGNGRFQGNVICQHGTSLVSLLDSISIPSDNSTLSLSRLPQNSTETTLENHTVAAINVLDIGSTTWSDPVTYGDPTTIIQSITPRDYNAVIIFRKSSNTTAAEDLMTNFTANDSTRIYLMNPEIDITTMSVIHILLFNDGFHICAVVAGYEEPSS